MEIKPEQLIAITKAKSRWPKPEPKMKRREEVSNLNTKYCIVRYCIHDKIINKIFVT